MAENFRKHLRKLMRTYGRKMLTVDEIYKEAPQRQLKLISECFDTCVDVVVENIEDPNILVDMCLIEDANDKTSTIRAHDFYNNIDINKASSDELKAIRQDMAQFLKDQCGILIIEDGNVKSIKRFMEKVDKDPAQSPHSINDLNRVSILCSQATLLDQFSDKLSQKNNANTFCAKEKWEFKKFGMISKSNYLFIDGFPAEIHLSEPKQFMLSQILTHLVYETIRAPAKEVDDEITFNLLFQDLPKQASKSIDDKLHLFDFDERETSQILILQIELEELIENNKEKSYAEKKNALLDFHMKSHSDFYELGASEWKILYEEAKKEYILAIDTNGQNNRPQSGGQKYGI